ncbi:MAG: hypothetical protein ABH865_02630 [Candidatus Omnitrophota bacterium]|nr:hypothetical protein [Candidatus Omnitrophota bacterium]
MSPRKACLLKNENLVRATLALKEELFKDFSDNLLKKCASCGAGIEEKSRRDTREINYDL